MLNIDAFIRLSYALCHTLIMYIVVTIPAPTLILVALKFVTRSLIDELKRFLMAQTVIYEREDPQREATEELTAVSHKVRCSNLISQINKNAYNGNGRILCLSE